MGNSDCRPSSRSLKAQWATYARGEGSYEEHHHNTKHDQREPCPKNVRKPVDTALNRASMQPPLGTGGNIYHDRVDISFGSVCRNYLCSERCFVVVCLETFIENRRNTRNRNEFEHKKLQLQICVYDPCETLTYSSYQVMLLSPGQGINHNYYSIQTRSYTSSILPGFL